MKKYSYLALVLLLVITSCAKPEEPVENKPTYQEDASVNIVKEEVVLYVDTDASKGFGDLYIKKNNGEREKIASNVLRGQFKYQYNTKAALYLDKNNSLNIKETGKPVEQISTDVYSDSFDFSKDESTILFLKSAIAKDFSLASGDLYSMVKGKEKEKLSSEVEINQYSLSDDGKVATFLTKDGSLYRKSIDLTDKEKLGSDVINYKTSPDGSTTTFENKESSIYLKKATVTDKEKIASNHIGWVQFSKDNKTLAYLDEYKISPSKGELMLLKEGYDKVKLASDITNYQFTAMGDYIYFLNEDKMLYMKILSDAEVVPSKKKTPKPTTTVIANLTLNPAEKVKLGQEVTSFKVSPDGTSIVYIDTDSNLFLKRFAEEKVKIASDISEVSLYNQTILMLNKEKTLYTLDLTPEVVAGTEETKVKVKETASPTTQPASPVKDKVKVADLVESYSADSSLSYLAYKTTAGEVFSKLKGQTAPIKVTEKKDAYSRIHFLGVMLYEKLVTIDQITGSWKLTTPYEEGEYVSYVEITKDLQFISYNGNGEKLDKKFEFENATPNFVDMVFTKDSDDMFSLEVVDENALTFHYPNEGDEISSKAKRMTKELMDKEVKVLQAATEKQAKLDAKISEANNTAKDINYTYLYNKNESTKVYKYASTSDLAGTVYLNNQLYISETLVTESGELWCKSNVYFGDIGEYMDVWFTYKSIT